MIVIADSSALVALSICDSLSLLDDLFGEVKVPQAVYDEVCVTHKAESQALKAYLHAKVCEAPTSVSTDKGKLIRIVSQ